MVKTNSTSPITDLVCITTPLSSQQLQWHELMIEAYLALLNTGVSLKLGVAAVSEIRLQYT